MPLHFGRKFLAIPGPTTVPDEVLQAMHRPAIDIYEGELEEITARILRDMKRVFRAPDAKTFTYIANGHGAWDAAISNTMSRGDRILVLECGRFAVGWGEAAAKMGVEVEILPGRPRGGVDLDALETKLRENARLPGSQRYKAILTVQVDTATSVHIDIPQIRATMDAAGHPAMLFADGIASIGCVPFEMAEWGVDLAITGSQKGLMTPPGLAMMAVGEKAWEARSRADLVTSYWDWQFRLGEVHYQKYCGTPPEHLLFGLNRALDLLLEEEGLENAWARHKVLAEASRAAVSAWAESGAVSFNILDPAERCDTVTMVRVEDGYDGPALRTMTAENLGLALGTAIGGIGGPGGGFRIAHMGHVSAPSMLGVLGATEAAMQALGWPVSGGVSAAVKVMGSALRA